MIEENGQFRFEEMPIGHGYVEPPLGNTERGMLRALAHPGGPLHQIQESLLDYRNVIKDTVMQLDITKRDEFDLAKKLMTEAAAIQWQYEMWERMLSVLPEEQEEPSND